MKLDIQSTLNVHCKHIQISQVLLNLLMNSVQAIESLKIKWIEIKAQKKGEEIIFDVIDSGEGIAEEIVDNIFQPFFTSKGVGKVTGLGMSVSKQIAESHHGKLIYQELNGHTCFQLSLPINPILS